MTTSARDALWLLFILIIVGVVWSLSGKGIGNLDLSSFSKEPRLSPGKSSEITYSSQSIFGNREQIVEKAKEKITTPSSHQITISLQTAQNTDPQKEYITIRNSGPESINLSGAEIKNKDNISEKIENDENGKPIILNPGDTAHILTGKSTKGANFKVNKCSGYFNQFHNFIPTLSTRCSTISNLPEVKNLDDVCLEYLPKVRSCQTPTSLPTNLSSTCQNFIQQHANYQGCVIDHKNDKDFDKGEWRMFLNRTTEFWAKRNETIKLVDQTGKVIAEANY